MFLSFARVSRLALQQFHRNLWLSIATITLLVLPLLTVNLVIGLGVLGRAAKDAVQDKIDVSVYFKTNVKDDAVQEIQTSLRALPEVKDVAFIPKDEALVRFKARHKDDPVIMESLNQVGENPFGATLAIKAHDPEQYQRVLTFLEDPKYGDLIEEKNFEDHRIVIGKINSLLHSVRSFGLAVAAIFGAIGVLIVINTVRVAVYTHRNEIRVMRLVGAGNWFIRGPFLFEALFFSLVATVFTALIVYPGMHFVQPYLNNLFSGVDISLVSYFNRHFVYIFGGEFLGVLLITSVSSFFAVRRYLKV